MRTKQERSSLIVTSAAQLLHAIDQDNTLVASELADKVGITTHHVLGLAKQLEKEGHIRIKRGVPSHYKLTGKGRLTAQCVGAVVELTK